MIRSALASLSIVLPAVVLPMAPVAAQDVPFDPQIVRACLAGPDAAGCIGTAAERCAAETGSNVGYGLCLGAELDIWDAELNRAYGALMSRTKDNDAEAKEFGLPTPPVAPILRDAQRAWIRWRDAQCAHARAMFGGGSGGGPAEVECRMRLTAEQALRLDASFGEQGG